VIQEQSEPSNITTDAVVHANLYRRVVAILRAMLGVLPIPKGALGGPAYTPNFKGTAFLFEHRARAIDENSKTIAPAPRCLWFLVHSWNSSQ
jgi:hypothetical protein